MTQAIVKYGPPGTGKTTSLTDDIEREVRAGHPVTVVSYTKAAAKEIADRAIARTGANDLIHASTVHSLAFALGKCKMSSAVSVDKLQDFTRAAGIPFSGRAVREDDDITQLEIGDQYLAVYNLARARLAGYYPTYENTDRPGMAEEFEYFCTAYDEWKLNHGFYDFADMLTRAVGVPHECPVLVVDEAQDLSPAQWQLIYGWARSAHRVYLAGDDDQAIYVWSGAKPSGMFEFERDFDATRVILDQSYRIPLEVHRLANEIITPVVERVAKAYKPRAEQGLVERYDAFQDVPIRGDEDTLILYRNHSLRRDIEDILLSRTVPHVFDNGGRSILQSPLANVARAWERGEPWTTLSLGVRGFLRRVYDDRQYRAFEATGEWPSDPLKSPLQSYRLRNSLAEFRRANNDQLPDPDGCRIHLSSIHGAKGREADHVVLINGMSGKTVTSYETDKDTERRVFYVGATRARSRLSIVLGENALDILL